MTTAAPAAKPAPKSVLRRTLIGAILVGLMLVPVIIMVPLTVLGTGHIEAGTAASAPLATLATLVAVVVGGRDLGLRVAIVMTILAPLAVVAGISPVSGAALMAVMCLVVGFMSRYGLHRAGLLVPVLIAWPLICPPPWGADPAVTRTDTSFLLWLALSYLVGGIVPVLIAPLLLRKAKLPAPKPNPRKEAIVYTVIITVLTTIGTYYVLAHPSMYAGAFLIAAIMVLAPIGEAQPLRPTTIRVAGTVAGSVLVLLVMAAAHTLLMVYVLGLVFGVAAVAAKFRPRAWIYYVFMVPTTACLNAYAVPEVASLGEQRIVDNIVGGVLVVLASAAALGYAHLEAGRGNSTSERPAIAGQPETP